MRISLRKNEHDSSDLKFLNNQYVSKIQGDVTVDCDYLMINV